MMRVSVELHPGGDAGRKKTIATFDIANMSELAPTSAYRVHGWTDRLGLFVKRVEGHDRASGWIPLVKRILDLIAEAEAPR